MGSAIAVKPQEKKSKAQAPAPASVEVPQIDQIAGVAAGMPLFLQRSPLQRSPAPGGCSCGASGAEEGECPACRQERLALQRERVQAKLVVGQPGDVYERQADRIAADAAAGGQTARQAPSRVAPTIPSPSSGSAIPVADSGSPLNPSIRKSIEPSLGADLSEVRVHGSPRDRDVARGLGAQAFTHGRDIWLGPSQSAADVKLMAHEATHVVQQGTALGKAPSVQRQEAGQPVADTSDPPQPHPKEKAPAGKDKTKRKATGKPKGNTKPPAKRPPKVGKPKAAAHKIAAKTGAAQALANRKMPARRPRGGALARESPAPAAISRTPDFIATPPAWETSEVVVPGMNSVGSHIVAEAVGHAAQAARHGLLESVTHGADAVHSEISQQRNQIFDAGTRQARQIHAAFDGARSQVNQAAAAAQTLLDSNAQAHQAALTQWLADAIAQSAGIFAGGSQRALGLGDSYGEQAINAANDSASQASGQLEAQIAQARSIGEARAATGGSKPEIAEAKAKAARDLADDTAQKVRDAVDDFLPDLRANGPNVAQSYRDQAAAASVQLISALPGVAEQLGEVHGATAQAISQAVSQASAAFSTMATQFSASLNASEQEAIRQLQQQVAQQAQQFNAVGEQAVAALDRAGQKAAKAGDDRLSGINRQLAGMDLDETNASATAATVAASVQNSYQPLYGQVDRTSTEVRNQIAQAGSAAVSAIDTSGPAAANKLRGVVTQARNAINTQGASVDAQLAGAVAQTRAGGDGMMKDLAGALDTQIADLDEGYGKGLADYRHGIDEQVAKGLDDVHEPITTLPDRITTAQAKIERDADKSWLRRQWDDFVDIISDPGFWAALLVGLVLVVLVIVFLPEELGVLAIAAIGAAIGAIAAGVGTVVSNLYHGRPWHENLLRNMAIGAAAGAVFALAAEGLAALGVGGIGFVAGMSVTAGLVTVATNLINGKPWDEGLLANMAFAGILAGIGKAFGKFAPKGPTEAPPPNEPVPGGNTPPPSEPVPGPNTPTPVPEPTKPVPPIPEPTKPLPPVPEPPGPEPPKPTPPAPEPPGPEPPKPVPPGPEPPGPEPPKPAPPGPEPPGPRPQPPNPEPPGPEPPGPKPQPPSPEPPGPEPPKPAPSSYPKSWSKFIADLNEAFKQRLNQFRGNNDLEPTFNKGGEGRVFAADGKLIALKRWFASRINDMPRSLQLLRDARAAIEPDPKLNGVLEVVKIEQTGPDWILRDFDPNTVELGDTEADPGAQAARSRAIAELQARQRAGGLSEILRNVLKKLNKNSDNLHWSDAKQKIIIIDMQ
jgi:hypothetical protein